MTEAGRKFFDEYVLELLADTEKKSEVADVYITEIVAHAAANDIRLSDIEEEVGQLHDALTNHILSGQKRSPAAISETGEAKLF